MGKSKAEKKKAEGVPNRHIHSRISFLHQAAAYLSSTAKEDTGSKQVQCSSSNDPDLGTMSASAVTTYSNQSRLLLSHFQGISRKTNIRVSKDLKRTICKRCQALLVRGLSSTETVRNASTNEAKPWADVFEVRCNACGAVKRYPVRGMQTKSIKAEIGTKDL